MRTRVMPSELVTFFGGGERENLVPAAGIAASTGGFAIAPDDFWKWNSIPSMRRST